MPIQASKPTSPDKTQKIWIILDYQGKMQNNSNLFNSITVKISFEINNINKNWTQRKIFMYSIQCFYVDKYKGVINV